MKIEIKSVVNYKGHSVKQNGSVDLSFSAMYDEITNMIKTLQMLNNDVSIYAKVPDEKAFSLGMFRIKEVKFADDGTSSVKFNSIDTSVEFDNLSRIITSDKFQVKLIAEIENEGEEEDG